ncbi:MAG: undecaprenyldiphospho-muramoylpentapeptide beta-N-acetylglucosaminyltransferase [Candidatus Cloacimonetes bacterium]|nr:undecaprenyldiphospho-muramoylpentapeptide beta-N-acetylglucosaminyltransferase [Candidatus Cloacimonadota bacterium]
MLRVAIAAGGTGGHIFPGIAIARELQDQLKSCEIIFIGSKDGIENKIVSENGYTCIPTDVHKLYRYLTLKNLLFPYYMIKSIVETRKIYRENLISLFVGCGGFVTGTAGYAAHLQKIPIFLQEQNSYPGLSTRFIAPYAKRIYLGNHVAIDYLKKNDNCLYTGNPIRQLNLTPRKVAQTELGFKDSKTLFIYGGSLGSTPINNAVLKIIESLLEKDYQIIFQTGKRDHSKIIEKYGNQRNMIIKPFFNDIDLVYSASDLVVCRAGAISLSEVAYFRIPAIIIPFPWAAGDHQVKNAESFAQNGAAVMIEEKDLTPEILLTNIENILNNTQQYEIMAHAMKSLAKPEATQHIVSDILMTAGIEC